MTAIALAKSLKPPKTNVCAKNLKTKSPTQTLKAFAIADCIIKNVNKKTPLLRWSFLFGRVRRPRRTVLGKKCEFYLIMKSAKWQIKSTFGGWSRYSMKSFCFRKTIVDFLLYNLQPLRHYVPPSSTLGASTTCAPLWLKICHWHIFFTRRALHRAGLIEKKIGRLVQRGLRNAVGDCFYIETNRNF